MSSYLVMDVHPLSPLLTVTGTVIGNLAQPTSSASGASIETYKVILL